MPSEMCKNLLSQLSGYLDGELEAALCTEIERHMAGCPDCRAVVNTMEKTIELYRIASNANRSEVPADVQARLYKVLKIDAPTHSG
jgi:RNA polymerase sigma-70 factor (ECF subfamily)